MSDEHQRNRRREAKALEMAMRDALDAMEELALLKAFHPGAEVVEIIAIEPPTRPQTATPAAPAISAVIPLTSPRRRDAG